MSASLALVRFERTWNIYFGCYEGTSDVMTPFLCTPDECYDKSEQRYCAISYCRSLARGADWTFPSNIQDVDCVEIYSDYGGGFYWSGSGSESAKMLKYPLSIYDENCCVHDGVPRWASDFLSQIKFG